MDQQSQSDAQWQPPAPQPTPRPYSPPPRGMGAAAKWAIGCGVALALAMLVFILLAAVAMFTAVGGGAGTQGNIALVRVEGAIAAVGEGPFGAVASSEQVIDHLQEAVDDRAVKAILVRIDSPGGSAAASQEIYAEVQRARRTKPVYVSMGDVAASGGYYIAAAAERVYANPGTVTGSIGVISANLDMSGLFKKIGISPEVEKTGEFKDMGSGMRPMTDRERALTRQLLNNIYQQFVGAVVEGRKLPKQTVLKLADGRIYTGEQAVKLKLVDELGGMRVAARALGQRAGIPGEPKLKEYVKPGLLSVLFGEMKSPAPPRLKGILYDRMADFITRGALGAGE